MVNEKSRFIFTLSAEGTKKMQDGELVLSSGGLRRPDGSLYEMATPVFVDPDLKRMYPNRSYEELIHRDLELTTNKLDLTIHNISALNDIAWMNYAINCRTYEMTYQGFQHVVEILDGLSDQLSKFEEKISNKVFNDRRELTIKYHNNLKSIAGFMESKNFNVSNSFLRISSVIDEIDAYFRRLHYELKTGSEFEQLVLESIVYLIGPYTYVIRRFSSLYKYENDLYPPNYEMWIKTLTDFTRDPLFSTRLQYHLRLNLNCSTEDILIATARTLFNIRNTIKNIKVDQEYIRNHTKEEYLSIDKQLQAKIESKDYQIINDHLCIEL